MSVYGGGGTEGGEEEISEGLRTSPFKYWVRALVSKYIRLTLSYACREALRPTMKNEIFWNSECREDPRKRPEGVFSYG